ncbi:MAG TPA: DedA family protein [Ktedonobacteraceae bacterium]|jgi:membrane protein DedA with SNARE-associated domain
MGNLHFWIELLAGLYNRYGYWIVLLGALAENTALLGLVLPGGTLALLGAFYARQGTLNLGWVIAFATLGTVLGYHIDYLFGRYLLGPLMTRWRTMRSGRLRLAARLRLARRMLTKHGGKAILLSHTMGHLRSFVAISAGAIHLKYRRFLAFEVLAALLWNTAYCLIGYLIAVEIDQLQTIIERAGWVMFAVLVVLFIIWQWWHYRRKQHLRQKRRQKNNLLCSRQ